MKILYVHNYYKIPGGEDTVVANEIDMLKKHGHEVMLYQKSNTELDSMKTVQKLLLPIKTIFNPKVYKEIKGLIKDNEIELVHVHNTLNMISPSVYYAAVKSGVSVVQTIHNFRFLCPGAMFLRDGRVCEECVGKSPLHAVRYGCYRNSRLQTMALALSNQIHRLTGIYSKISFICLTDFNKEKLLKLKQIKAENVYVKPNFVTDPQSPVEKCSDYYLFAGRLEKTKGIDFLVKAFGSTELSDRKLIVLGTGPLLEELKETVCSSNYKNVEIKGFVENAKAKEMIAQARAMILPTMWYEGFPMTIAESFSVGTPVICSDIGNPKVLVKEGISGALFETASTQGLVEAVKRLDEYPDIRNTTYKEYLDKYSQQINYQILMDIYKKVTAQRS